MNKKMVITVCAGIVTGLILSNMIDNMSEFLWVGTPLAIILFLCIAFEDKLIAFEDKYDAWKQSRK